MAEHTSIESWQTEPILPREPGAGSREPGAGSTLREVHDLGKHLFEHFERSFPDLDLDQIKATWNEVVFKWNETNDGSRGRPGVGYFHMRMRQRLLDVVSSERSRRAREAAWAQDKPLSAACREVPVEQLTRVAAEVEALGEELREQIAELLGPDERMAFELWLDGHRNTELFAKALDIPESIPIEEARKKVRRVKARLRMRLRRDPEIRCMAEPLRELFKVVREMDFRV